MLLDRCRAVGGSYLVPAHTGLPATHIGRMFHQERLITAKVTVDQSVHKPIAQAIKSLRFAGLQNATARTGA